jgi:hypothetical protein
MDPLSWLFPLIFVLICIADVYLDVVYKGLGAWVLSQEPFNRWLAPNRKAFQLLAPIVGLALLIVALTLVWLVNQWAAV